MLFGSGLAVYEVPLIGLKLTLGQAWDVDLASLMVSSMLAVVLGVLLVEVTLEAR